MTLGDAAHAVPGARIVAGSPGDPLVGVVHDSRAAGPGDLFVAIGGLRRDGGSFVGEAAGRGARAVAAGPSLAPVPGLGWIVVPDPRAALSALAALSTGRPTASLALVGITGTNGKTTTTFFVREVMRAAGWKTSLVGTIRYEIGDRFSAAPHTTPEATELQAHFARALAAGCRGAVMEVSSHALELRRADDCAFDVAVFTNLTQDHLDFHSDMAAYGASKRRLFERLALSPKARRTAVVNALDPASESISAPARAAGIPVVRYGPGSEASIRAAQIQLTTRGSEFVLEGLARPVGVTLRLPGAHNVENALAAAAVGQALGLADGAIVAGLAALTAVPGRFERVETGCAADVVVDYAHTPDALERTLRAARALWKGRVILVFGCGGDRDRAKRPRMGAIGAALADLAVITSDNPRSEAPVAICEEVAAGARSVSGATFEVVVDRREAIERALRNAGAGDVVLVAGKGHEEVQVLADRTIRFSDVETVREAARSIGNREGM